MKILIYYDKFKKEYIDHNIITIDGIKIEKKQLVSYSQI